MHIGYILNIFAVYSLDCRHGLIDGESDLPITLQSLSDKTQTTCHCQGDPFFLKVQDPNVPKFMSD